MGALSFIGFDLVQMTFAESLRDLESGDAVRLGVMKMDRRCFLRKGSR